jgi:hypothetical protein
VKEYSDIQVVSNDFIIEKRAVQVCEKYILSAREDVGEFLDESFLCLYHSP